MYLFSTPQISILTRPVCTCLPHHKFPSSLGQYVPVYHTTNFHPHQTSMHLFTTPQISMLTRPVCTCLPHHKFPSSLGQYVPVYHTTNFHPHSFHIHAPIK